MVRSSGVKLVRLIARYSSSTLANDLSNGATRPSIRQFMCKTSTGLVQNALNGRGLFGTSRAIHSSAFLCKDYYEMLGVNKNATPTELKKAFYGLAKKHHPDMNKDDPDAEKKFQEINKAYEVLKDDQQRAAYDQVGHDAFEQSQGQGGDAYGGSGFNPFEDMFRSGFEDVFNMFRPGRPSLRGQDVKVVLELSFMEAVQGCTKTIKFQTPVSCDACGGTGVPPGSKPETCKQCKGRGMTFMQKGPFSVQSTCMQCGGAGKTFASNCRSCRGNRVVPGNKSVRLDISAGVDSDETLKVSRSGGADPDGYDPGDLYVTIKVKDDPVFRREGSTIHVDTVLSISQAILGGTVQVPTLMGDVVLKVRPGTQPGQKVVLKKKGIKTRGSMSFGDQYVHFDVSVPTQGQGGDAYGGSGFNPFEDMFRSGFEDVFNMFRPGRPSLRGQDVKVVLELSFMEAVQGCTKTIKFQTPVSCDACGGTGVPPGSKPETCKQCKGRGMTFMQKGPFSVQSTCMQCGGAGKTFASNCRSCRGNRVVPGNKSVRLDISAGVDSDETLKVSRSGGADPDGYDPGDLYVTIKVKDDPVFRREGSTIHVDTVLSISQAILGGTVQVPTLMGDVVLKVRPGTQPGQKVVLKKKGIKTRGSMSFGDQYVHFDVSVPTSLSPRQRELIEEFAKEEQGENDIQASAAASG